MVEFFWDSLQVTLVIGLTWIVFYIPSFFGITVSLPAKVTLLVPVIAVNIVVATNIVECLEYSCGVVNYYSSQGGSRE